MDMRTSRVLLILAIIAIAWMSKDYWLPKISSSAQSTLFDQQQAKPAPLEKYSDH